MSIDHSSVEPIDYQRHGFGCLHQPEPQKSKWHWHDTVTTVCLAVLSALFVAKSIVSLYASTLFLDATTVSFSITLLPPMCITGAILSAIAIYSLLRDREVSSSDF